MLLFSVQRRLRDGSTKNTIENLREVSECVVHICTRDLAEQASLASHDFPKWMDEFGKAGFEKATSSLVRPFPIAEAAIAMECKVLQIISVGTGAGCAELVLAEVPMKHVDEAILAGDRTAIDPFKLTLASRLRGPWYAEMGGEQLFRLPKPEGSLAIGVDGLPGAVRGCVQRWDC